MIICASNGKEYVVRDGVEAEAIGPVENETLVIRDGRGNNIAFFNLNNIDGWGHEDKIETINGNTN